MCLTLFVKGFEILNGKGFNTVKMFSIFKAF